MIGLILILMLTGPVAWGNIIQVPEDFETIVEAVAEAEDGDSVLIARGTYLERLVMPPIELTLMSSFGMTSDTADIIETVLIPDPTNHSDTSAVIEIYEEEADVTLLGLTIREGAGINVEEPPDDWRMGGAIYQLRGALSIKNCVFTENNATVGIAIWSENSSLHIRGSEFLYNGSGLWNQGIVRGDSTVMEIFGTRFHHNTARGGSAVISAYGSLLMDSCRIDSNLNYHATLAHVLCHDGPATIRNCDFISNAGDTTFIGAICLHLQDSDATISNCNFVGNVSEGITALACTRVTAEITDCLFERNRAALSCTAVMFGGSGQLLRCSFIENSAYSWSCLDTQGDWDAVDCIFRNNISEWDSAGAVVAYRYSFTASNCIFENNIPYAVGGFTAESTQLQHFENCYWGDPSGPYHATLNPEGLGDSIRGDSISFIPWLTEPPQSVSQYPTPIPTSKDLLRAYPNPFNGQITLEYESSVRPRRIFIYNLLGRQVDMLEIMPYSQHALWNPDRLPSGIYFATLQSKTVKLVYMR